jgi:hypothetical protein
MLGSDRCVRLATLRRASRRGSFTHTPLRDAARRPLTAHSTISDERGADGSMCGSTIMDKRQNIGLNAAVEADLTGERGLRQA